MSAAEPTPLAYATPTASRPLGVAMALAFLALGLVFLSGCFLIGVGLALDVIGLPKQNAPPWSIGQYVYVGVLYCCMAITFGSGLWVAVVAVRQLTTA